MKKILAIPFALLLLISGMQLSIATHFCHDKIVATKISFSGKEASCGMESGETHNSETILTSKCCDDEVLVYSVDDNYTPSIFQFKEIARQILQEFYIPGDFTVDLRVTSFNNLSNVSPPPGYYPTNAVKLADICVFRI